MSRDRRRDVRLHPPKIQVQAPGLRLSLRNLGRAGMSLVSHGPVPITCGEEIRFRLDDGTHSVEILGQVRWVDTPPTGHDEAPGSAGQEAGVAFVQLLSEEPLGVWKRLVCRRTPDARKPAAEQEEREEVAASDELTMEGALARILEPKDGDIVDTPVIEVLGQVKEELDAISVTVNGTPATIEGGRFRVTVRLRSGENKISATVHKSSGGYNTCLLGTLRLDPEWKASRRWP